MIIFAQSASLDVVAVSTYFIYSGMEDFQQSVETIAASALPGFKGKNVQFIVKDNNLEIAAWKAAIVKLNGFCEKNDVNKVFLTIIANNELTDDFKAMFSDRYVLNTAPTTTEPSTLINDDINRSNILELKSRPWYSDSNNLVHQARGLAVPFSLIQSETFYTPISTDELNNFFLQLEQQIISDVEDGIKKQMASVFDGEHINGFSYNTHRTLLTYIVQLASRYFDENTITVLTLSPPEGAAKRIVQYIPQVVFTVAERDLLDGIAKRLLYCARPTLVSQVINNNTDYVIDSYLQQHSDNNDKIESAVVGSHLLHLLKAFVELDKMIQANIEQAVINRLTFQNLHVLNSQVKNGKYSELTKYIKHQVELFFSIKMDEIFCILTSSPSYDSSIVAECVPTEFDKAIRKAVVPYSIFKHHSRIWTFMHSSATSNIVSNVVPMIKRTKNGFQIYYDVTDSSDSLENLVNSANAIARSNCITPTAQSKFQDLYFSYEKLNNGNIDIILDKVENMLEHLSGIEFESVYTGFLNLLRHLADEIQNPLLKPIYKNAIDNHHDMEKEIVLADINQNVIGKKTVHHMIRRKYGAMLIDCVRTALTIAAEFVHKFLNKLMYFRGFEVNILIGVMRDLPFMINFALNQFDILYKIQQLFEVHSVLKNSINVMLYEMFVNITQMPEGDDPQPYIEQMQELFQTGKIRSDEQFQTVFEKAVRVLMGSLKVTEDVAIEFVIYVVDCMENVTEDDWYEILNTSYQV